MHIVVKFQVNCACFQNCKTQRVHNERMKIKATT